MSQYQAWINKLKDNNVDLGQRANMLKDVAKRAQEGEDSCIKAIAELLQQLGSGGPAKGEEEVEAQDVFIKMLNEIENMPLRLATFVRLDVLSEGSPLRHALVSLDNGELAFVLANDIPVAEKLKIGDRVMLDAKGKLLMHPAINDLYFGSEARFERKIDEEHLEVITHQDERSVVMAGKEVMAKIDSGEATPGSHIIVGSGGRFATKALPPASKELSHLRFLDRGGVPDIIVSRDIGDPPRVIFDVVDHVREEMLRPELRRRFKLRPCITKLLCGVSGSGKTLAVQAIHRRIYEIMSEVTGTPINDLPPRVFRFRNSQMLSMWMGESDKNADRLFDEVEQHAARKFTAKSGKEFRLPVLVIMEEADGMGLARGQDAIYDRILTTILQRLDPNRAGLSDQLVVFLSTTNEQQIVDPAFLRRIGGTVEVFGRLSQKGFLEVLKKHIDGMPAQSVGGKGQKESWRSVLSGINESLFHPDKDPGVVELTFHGGGKEIKHQRDFLTGALVDRAVQQAATEAWKDSISKDPKAGIRREQLERAFSDQVRHVADQLCPQNVSHYIDLPEGVHVTGVRRLYHK